MFITNSHQDIPVAYNPNSSSLRANKRTSSRTNRPDDHASDKFSLSDAPLLTEELLHLQPGRKRRTIEQEPLHRWMKEMDSYLAEFLRSEGHCGSHVCAGCGEEARFRCVSCCNGTSACQSCIVKAHRTMPFHGVEVCISLVWTSSYS